jgi:acyl phosphate:glycerol-3-phosphate acyltransferase
MINPKFLYWIIIACGYLLGSVMFSKEIPLLLGYGDITEKSNDMNPGASNVFKNCGIPCGIACLFCDMLKGFLPVFIANFLFGIDSVRFALVMLAPVLGHAFPIMNHLKGGKCIATSFGVLIGCFPSSYIGFLLAGLYIFFSVFIKINPHRMRSIVTFLLFALFAPLILHYFHQPYVALGCILISAVAILKHTKIFVPDADAEKQSANNDSAATQPKSI